MAESAHIQKGNNKLSKYFRPDRRGEYDQVQVLMISWEESDLPGLAEEEAQLARLFREDFKYEVDYFRIPLNESDWAIDEKLSQFMGKLRGIHKPLGIIYYGGHGDADVDYAVDHYDATSVWASHREGGSILRWSDIQPRLARVGEDILLLLDCCYAAQAARGSGRLVIPANVELLAACAKGRRTPGPLTEQSFTLALIREIKQGLVRRSKNGPVTIRDIHQRLTSMGAGLKETPVYFPHRKGTIRLEPLLEHPQTLTKQSNDSISGLTLRINLRNKISDQLVDDVVLWLRTNAPSDVAQVRITELVDRTVGLREFVHDDNDSHFDHSTLGMSRLPQPSQNIIRDAWDRFTERLAWSLNYLPGNSGDEDRHKTKFLDNLETNVGSLQRQVEREILTSPQLQEVGSLEHIIEQPQSQILGLANAFRVRLTTILPQDKISSALVEDISPTSIASMFPQPSPLDGLTVVNYSGQIRPVLVEWKEVEDDEIRGQDIFRIERLASVLKAAGVGGFRTPECLGCHIPGARKATRYGIMFKVPEADAVPVTLYTLLREHQAQSSRKTPLPSLGNRFRLAYEIAQALLRWHQAGWLHQGLASYNIVFFKTSPNIIDYSKPYLMGFDYSREESSHSMKMRSGDPWVKLVHDLYRHPERQGESPATSHKRHHDLYSLGLVLVEIGRWSTVDVMFGSLVTKRKTNEPVKIREVALKLTERVLGHSMGISYQDAAMACLTGDLGESMDDERGTALAAHFDAKIVRRLEAGLRLDI